MGRPACSYRPNATPANRVSTTATTVTTIALTAAYVLRANTAAREAAFEWGTRDVLAMSRNAVHEQTHHLLDVTRILGSQGTGPGPA